MRILHISDYHYISHKERQHLNKGKLFAEEIQKHPFDVLVFSGDLVNHEANILSVFSKAFNALIQPIMDACQLPLNRVIIAPGNHDIDRHIESDMVTSKLEGIKSIEDLEKFIEDPRQKEASLERVNNYNLFVRELYKDVDVKISDFFTCFFFIIEEKRTGVCTLNSAWRSFDSTKDRGNLLFPLSQLEEAIEYLNDKECDVKICVMHHNLSDFKDYIDDEMSDLIHKNFDILLTGHYHKSHQKVHSSSEVGLLHDIAYAVFNRADKLSKYGFSIIDYDCELYTATIEEYVLVEEKFLENEKRIISLPLSEAKDKLNKLRIKIRNLRNQALTKADKLFVSGHQCNKTEDYSFSKLFIDPVIGDKSYSETIASGKKGSTYSIDDIRNSIDHIVVFGSDKSGKSSLLRKILIDSYQYYFEKKTIPFLIDFKDYKGDSLPNLKGEIPSYLEVNKRDANAILNEYTLLVLVDGARWEDPAFMDWIRVSVAEIPSIRFIITVPEEISASLPNFQIGEKNAVKMFIHNISSKEIHQLTLRWPNLSSNQAKEIESKLIKIFTQMEIPFNYWTASLFLWIFEKTDKTNVHNNFDLVNYYVDEILNKSGLAKHQILQIQYDDLQLYLGALAHEILMHNYELNYNELIQFTNSYRNDHMKFTETSRNIIDYLIDNGVIIEKSKDRFTFRLNGVFEFFLAYHMTAESEFLDQVLEDRNKYLSYRNELEMYAGFRPDDNNFVTRVFGITKNIVEPITHKIGYENVDDNLKSSLDKTFDFTQSVRKLANNFPMVEIDDNHDVTVFGAQRFSSTGEVRVKEKYDQIIPNAENIYRALFILSRVYRNSRVCDQPIGPEIFDFVLTGICNVGFLLNDEAIQYFKEQRMEEISSVFNEVLPLLVHTLFFDAITQKNLLRIFRQKFEELKRNADENQFKIFILGFTLLNLDADENADVLEDLKALLHKGALRHAAGIKAMLLLEQDKYNVSTEASLKKFIIDIKKSEGNKDPNRLIDDIIRTRNNKLLDIPRQ